MTKNISGDISKDFFKKLLYIGAAFCWLYITLYFIPSTHSWIDVWIFLTLIYAIAISLVAFYFHKKGFESKDPQDGYNYTMLTTTVRLFASIGFLAIYFVIVKKNLEIFISNFFILYFVFTLFEIKTFMYNLRAHSKKEQEENGSKNY